MLNQIDKNIIFYQRITAKIDQLLETNSLEGFNYFLLFKILEINRLNLKKDNIKKTPLQLAYEQLLILASAYCNSSNQQKKIYFRAKNILIVQKKQLQPETSMLIPVEFILMMIMKRPQAEYSQFFSNQTSFQMTFLIKQLEDMKKLTEYLKFSKQLDSIKSIIIKLRDKRFKTKFQEFKKQQQSKQFFSQIGQYIRRMLFTKRSQEIKDKQYNSLSQTDKTDKQFPIQVQKLSNNMKYYMQQLNKLIEPLRP